jgi:hypothetical protein
VSNNNNTIQKIPSSHTRIHIRRLGNPLMDELVITWIMHCNIRMEEVEKVKAVIFITSDFKLNTERKYKAIKISML